MQCSRPLPGARKKSQRKEKDKIRAPEESTSQKTISELFISSKHRRDAPTTDCSPNKRLKPNANCDSKTLTSTKPIDLPNMYTFKSSSPMANGVIDLTTSPDESPVRGSFIQSKERRTSGAVRPNNFSPHMGARKLVIKNLRTTSKANPYLYYDQTWNQLDTALSAIFSGKKPQYSLEELYRGVENVCRQDKAPNLFEKLYAKCAGNLSTMILPQLVHDASSTTSSRVLGLVMKAWSTWSIQMVSGLSYYS